MEPYAVKLGLAASYVSRHINGDADVSGVVCFLIGLWLAIGVPVSWEEEKEEQNI